MGKMDGFGAALKALRKAQEEEGKPLTLQALSRRTGIHYTNLSGYEKEREWPGRSTLERILDGLNVTFIDLAVETVRQGRMVAGLPPGLPPPAHQEEDPLEERIRQIVRQEFGAGLRAIAGLPSEHIDRLAEFIRGGGVEPDLESLALLQSILDRPAGGSGA